MHFISFKDYLSNMITTYIYFDIISFLFVFVFDYVNVGDHFITTCRQRKWLPTTALITNHHTCSSFELLLSNPATIVS